MAQQLRILSALPENWSSVLNNQVRRLRTIYLALLQGMSCLWPSQALACTHVNIPTGPNTYMFIYN